MAGKFEIYKDRGGKFRFRLKASNGGIILASQGYKSRAGCNNGIASVQKNAKTLKQFESKTSRNGKHMFCLKSLNGQVVGTSEMYNTTRARDNGIKSVKTNAPKAKIDSLT